MNDGATDNDGVNSETELREIYKRPSEMNLRATTDYLHPFHIAHLKLASFVCIGTVGDEGLDVSPRGGEPGFVQVVGENRVGIPDWPGNNKIESMTNIVRDQRLGMLFLFPGLDYFMRLNGKAVISRDPALCEQFAHGGKTPKTVIVVTVDQAYFHCGKAINRARLWEPSSRIPRDTLPSVGTIMTELTKVTDVSVETLNEAYKRGVKEDLYDAPPDLLHGEPH